MKINELKDNAGARNTYKRVGRGIGSGKGKTCGSGTKGQKSRTGVAIKGFEGGQMPIHRRLPKRGFKNPDRVVYTIVNLGSIQTLINNGIIDKTNSITKEVLSNVGLISNLESKLKILSKGEFNTSITIEANSYSESALEIIKKFEGNPKLLEKNS
jgi:large subunit ribosomal protein L15